MLNGSSSTSTATHHQHYRSSQQQQQQQQYNDYSSYNNSTNGNNNGGLGSGTMVYPPRHQYPHQQQHGGGGAGSSSSPTAVFGEQHRYNNNNNNNATGIMNSSNNLPPRSGAVGGGSSSGRKQPSSASSRTSSSGNNNNNNNNKETIASSSSSSSTPTANTSSTGTNNTSELVGLSTPNTVAETKFEDDLSQSYYFDASFDEDGSCSAASSQFSGGNYGSYANNGNKVCLPGSTSFLHWARNKKKVASTDIASVGNASDTQVVVSDGGKGGGGANGGPGFGGSANGGNGSNGVPTSFSGRDLHESAKMHLNKREYKIALEYFEAILSAQVQRFGPLHPSVGAAIHNVGVCRQRMEQYALAANLLAEAVQIRKQTLGETHIECAVSLSKLGMAQAALGQYEEAFRSVRQAISISKEQLGYYHKTTGQMICHQAALFFEKNELFAAEATFEDAYDIYRTVYEASGGAAKLAVSQTVDESAKIACRTQMTDALCNIGSIQIRRKQYERAIETFTKALNQMKTNGVSNSDGSGRGTTNPLQVISTLDNMAYAYSKTKDYASALKCYQRMFTAQTTQRKFTPSSLETFRKQIIMYEKLKRTSEALDVAKDTLRLAKSVLPKQDKMITELKAVVDDLVAKKNKGSSKKSNPVAI